MVMWPVCPPCCLKIFTNVVGGRIQSPSVGSIERTLDYSKPIFNKWSQLYPFEYIVDCCELVEYRRQWLIVDLPMVIVLTVVLIIWYLVTALFIITVESIAQHG